MKRRSRKIKAPRHKVHHRRKRGAREASAADYPDTESALLGAQSKLDATHLVRHSNNYTVYSPSSKGFVAHRLFREAGAYHWTMNRAIVDDLPSNAVMIDEALKQVVLDPESRREERREAPMRRAAESRSNPVRPTGRKFEPPPSKAVVERAFLEHLRGAIPANLWPNSAQPHPKNWQDALHRQIDNRFPHGLYYLFGQVTDVVPGGDWRGDVWFEPQSFIERTQREDRWEAEMERDFPGRGKHARYDIEPDEGDYIHYTAEELEQLVLGIRRGASEAWRGRGGRRRYESPQTQARLKRESEFVQAKKERDEFLSAYNVGPFFTTDPKRDWERIYTRPEGEIVETLENWHVGDHPYHGGLYEAAVRDSKGNLYWQVPGEMGFVFAKLTPKTDERTIGSYDPEVHSEAALIERDALIEREEERKRKGLHWDGAAWTRGRKGEEARPVKVSRVETISDWHADTRFHSSPLAIVGRLANGKYIATSSVVSAKGRLVKTQSGSTYRLGNVNEQVLEYMKAVGIPFDPENPIVFVKGSAHIGGPEPRRRKRSGGASEAGRIPSHGPKAAKAIEDAIALFPETFGLHGHPGDKFRISRSASYINDNGQVTLYTERFSNGEWRDFAKGSIGELHRNIVKFPASREVRDNPVDDVVGDALPWVKVSRDPERYEAALKEAKAIGPIDDPKKVYELVGPALLKEDQETFIVILLDVRQQCRGVAEIHRGGRSRVPVSLVDVLRVVVASGAEGFVVVHNHPSGKASPSDADKDLTKSIERAAKLFDGDLSFVDHVICGSGEFYSFADEKLHKLKS